MTRAAMRPSANSICSASPVRHAAVALISLAFVIGTLAIILGNWPLFWGAVALVIVGAITGKVLAMMGFGKKRA